MSKVKQVTERKWYINNDERNIKAKEDKNDSRIKKK